MKDPLRILQMLILEIGTQSEGWGVDILIEALSYLSYGNNPIEFLKTKPVEYVSGVAVRYSTVALWWRGVPRGIERPEKGRILYRQ
jgi:hypothetical protein